MMSNNLEQVLRIFTTRIETLLIVEVIKIGLSKLLFSKKEIKSLIRSQRAWVIIKWNLDTEASQEERYLVEEHLEFTNN